MTCVLDECQQGHKPCPDPAVCCGSTRRLSPEEMTRRQQEAELRWQCRDQKDSRQLAAHFAAGDFLPIGDRHAGIVGFAAGEVDGLGVEAADAARVTGTPIVTDEIRQVREPWWRLPPLGARKPLPPTTAWEWVGFCGVAALIGLWVWIVRG